MDRDAQFNLERAVIIGCLEGKDRITYSAEAHSLSLVSLSLGPRGTKNRRLRTNNILTGGGQ
jgi:hypothetical protein